mmetsp:Transcript_14761/g.18714  ORF Transcript_14761/g.18714 Transcript_14761/m.18714 type:complete len:85 (-) Transcript_14761:1012-1266(-)
MTQSTFMWTICLFQMRCISHAVLGFGMMSAPQRLRQLLESEMDGTRKDANPILLPCCYDGLSARLIARAGFEATFMTGFGVSGE